MTWIKEISVIKTKAGTSPNAAEVPENWFAMFTQTQQKHSGHGRQRSKTSDMRSRENRGKIQRFTRISPLILWQP